VKVNRILTAQMTALAMMLALSACGDGGGVSSTPTPTPASYTKIADLSGDRTFQTAGVQYNTGAGGFTNGSTQALGSGVTVAYTASNDSYKLTAPDNSTATFGPANVVTSPPPPANTMVWANNNGTSTDRLNLIVPTTAQGVPLSYTLVGTWGHLNNPGNSGVYRIAVGGMPTLASDMPRMGSATYTVGVGGAAIQNGAAYTLDGNSSATFTANFAANSVTTALNLAGTPVQPGTPFPGGTPATPFGSFTGTGMISSSGPGFTGTLTGTGVTGVFSGAFFGPQALEMGYGWYLSGTQFNAVGVATGVKHQ
jgi:hypothetical protein